ncbi:MAG: AMP-binding protein [Chthoniobacter sp.]|nr:AMP-binding protein [Chthoniobacter sp.]
MNQASQFERLRALLAEILPRNRFVAQRLGDFGELRDLADFTTRVPFTHKLDLVADQAAHPPYGSNLTFPQDHYTRFCQTSGTTGRPLAILDTAESWQWMLGNWRHIYEAAGVAPGARVYFAFSFGPFLGFWTAFEAATQHGCLGLPGGGLSSAARVRAMIEHRAEVLCCTPTYALRLLDVAREENLDLRAAEVRTIIVAGEPGGSVPAVRARLRAGWNGARVVDHYGMTEVGPVAYEDPQREGVMRILENAYFAEVIEPGGVAAVAEGGIGELVLTPLGRSAWPLLRYRTGDLVRWSRDEHGLALEGGIIGRADDMIVVRGVNIYPTAVEAVVRTVPEIGEYRVLVSQRGAMSELEVQIESPDDTSASRLERALNQAFSLRIPATHVGHGTLPRFEMKARRWVNV